MPRDPFPNSKDPYDFTSLESGHAANQFKPVLNSNHKPNVKPKSKPVNNPNNRTKTKDVLPGSRSPAQTIAGPVLTGINSINSQPIAAQGVKRKRSSVGSSPFNNPLQQTSYNVISNATSINSHTNNNALTAIAIPPGVNLSTATLSQLNANLTQAKAQKNTFYKDLGGFLVTNLDSANLVNGQYINITNSASNAQRVDDKSFQQTHVIASKNKPQILNLEKLPALQKNNVIAMPPFIVEGLQSGTAVLAPVSLATSLNTPIVAMTTNTSVSPSQPSPSNYRSVSEHLFVIL